MWFIIAFIIGVIISIILIVIVCIIEYKTRKLRREQQLHMLKIWDEYDKKQKDEL
jgi:hypothetical protein